MNWSQFTNMLGHIWNPKISHGLQFSQWNCVRWNSIILTTQKTKILKNEKSIWRCHHFKLEQQKTRLNDVCLLRYGVQGKFLSFEAIFCSFTPLLTLKIKIWKKCKTHLEILLFYTYAPEIKIIWCEIQSENHKVFLSFWAIFCTLTLLTEKSKFWKNKENLQRYYHFTLVYHKWRSYDVWLCFEKMKTKKGKNARDIIILHKCTINNNHMIYGSWNITCNRHIFFPFNPPNSPKNENIKKMKTPGLEILSIYTSVPKLMIIGCTVLEIWCMMDVIVVFHFGQFFALSPP